MPKTPEINNRLLKKHLLERYWGEIREIWTDSLPSIDRIEDPPAEAVDDHIPLVETVRAASPLNEPLHDLDVPGLRSIALHESCFLALKAWHVAGTVNLQLNEGYSTWPLSDAFQASLFAAKSLMRLVGVLTVEVDNKSLLIDLFARASGRTGSRKASKVNLSSPASITLVPCRRVENRHHWQILARLSRVTIIDSPNLDALLANLGRLDPTDVGQQRNRLLYRSNQWFFDDILGPASHTVFANTSLGELTYSGPKTDFSIRLLITLLHTTTELFRSLGNEAPTIRPYAEHLADTAENNLIHRRYREAIKTLADEKDV